MTTTKALNINLDESRYGVFAEIGAGQEVARYFFQAGKASQTIAKTMSAYDMIVSDDIYGKEKSGRYVCESRVKKMLDCEFDLLVKRLSKTRGDKSAFFAFADTVATFSSSSGRQSHGWMGVRFQSTPMGESNEILLHVRMLDRHRLQQQESLGILGVNLLDAAFYRTQSLDAFLKGLMDNIKEGHLAIDLIRLSGPDLAHLDSRILNLMLVKRKIADAIIFAPNMEILDVSETVFNKALLIQRGIFRPVTVTHLDILEKGKAQLQNDMKPSKESLSLMELHLPDIDDAEHSEKDFLSRIEWLTQSGQTVLVSQFSLFYGLKKYLRRYTQGFMALVVGAAQLEKLFDEQHYTDLDGGLLEGMGKLLDAKTKLYVYPHKDGQVCLTTQSFFPKPEIANVYKHFTANNQITDIAGCDGIAEYLHSAEVMSRVSRKEKGWEKLVPASIVEKLKNTHF